MQQSKGYLSLVLHAHLPFVRHPEIDYMQEENWFFEAITETYVPLLTIFNNCFADAVPFRITMSLTPTLCSMLSDQLLQERYHDYISRLISLAEKEIVRTKSDPNFSATAHMYRDKFDLCRQVFFDRYHGNIVKGFRALQEQGVLEIITCGATHGFLPNMQYNMHAVRAQIQVAVQSYHNHFGTAPKGIWLPECGYFPGVETLLNEASLKYFFTDTHGILFAEPRPKYGVFAPVNCKNAPVAAFGRDMESSKAVWSSKIGYPGDHAYRDFYRDIGYDLDIDYIRPYIDPIGHRLHTGIKYYKITGQTENKEPYHYQQAMDRAFEHAGNFLFNRQKQVEHLHSIMDRRPIIVAPYDAELFGHWWYEGPHWLNFLIRKTAFEQDTIALVTPSDYLSEYPTNQVCEPSLSSWGQKGYSEMWLESSNDWIYRHVHLIEDQMVTAAKKYPNSEGIRQRALNQMARELLLAEASDWAFIMKTGTMVEYAVRRTREHITNFQRLHHDLENDKCNRDFISLLESHNNIFPDINYLVYA